MRESGILLSTRIKEHKSALLNNKKKSTLVEHVPLLKKTGHKLDFYNVTIIHGENNEKMTVVEAIHIMTHRPSLNRQVDMTTASLHADALMGGAATMQRLANPHDTVGCHSPSWAVTSSTSNMAASQNKLGGGVNVGSMYQINWLCI